ncbi:hypothetical protein ScPMuIL_001385 [Solemya velum]
MTKNEINIFQNPLHVVNLTHETSVELDGDNCITIRFRVINEQGAGKKRIESERRDWAFKSARQGKRLTYREQEARSVDDYQPETPLFKDWLNLDSTSSCSSNITADETKPIEKPESDDVFSQPVSESPLFKEWLNLDSTSSCSTNITANETKPVAVPDSDDVFSRPFFSKSFETEIMGTLDSSFSLDRRGTGSPDMDRLPLENTARGSGEEEAPEFGQWLSNTRRPSTKSHSEEHHRYSKRSTGNARYRYSDESYSDNSDDEDDDDDDDDGGGGGGGGGDVSTSSELDESPPPLPIKLKSISSESDNEPAYVRERVDSGSYDYPKEYLAKRQSDTLEEEVGVEERVDEEKEHVDSEVKKRENSVR